jgi:hypothetical protein
MVRKEELGPMEKVQVVNENLTNGMIWVKWWKFTGTGPYSESKDRCSNYRGEDWSGRGLCNHGENRGNVTHKLGNDIVKRCGLPFCPRSKEVHAQEI